MDNRVRHPEWYLLFQHVRTDRATPPDLAGQVRQLAAEFDRILRELIAQAQATGEVTADDDPGVLAVAVTACLRGLAETAMEEPRRAQRLPDASVVLRMLAPSPREGNRG